MENKISFEGFSDFEFNIVYSELERKNHFKQIDNHVHSECEIYINLTGENIFKIQYLVAFVLISLGIILGNKTEKGGEQL